MSSSLQLTFSVDVFLLIPSKVVQISKNACELLS